MGEFFIVGLLVFLCFIVCGSLTALSIWAMVRLICWLDDEAKERRE